VYNIAGSVCSTRWVDPSSALADCGRMTSNPEVIQHRPARNPRPAVTAEVASSSLVVPAIFLKDLRPTSPNHQGPKRTRFRVLFCVLLDPVGLSLCVLITLHHCLIILALTVHLLT
jgi:hypothetical protein